MGRKNSHSEIHNSGLSNLFVQVHGEKEWLLYPPQLTPAINPRRSDSIYRTAVLTPEFPDSEQIAPYDRLPGYYVKLSPGDLLFNPPFWWHSVRNCSESMGIGYRWFNLCSAFRSSFTMSFIDCFSTNPSLFGMYKYRN